MDGGLNMNSHDGLTDEEIFALSSKLREAFDPLHLVNHEATFTGSRLRSRQLTIPAIALLVVALFSVMFFAESQTSPVWSATPITVNSSQRSAILETCASLLSHPSNSSTLDVVDFRKQFGEAVISTKKSGLGKKLYECDFMQLKGGEFEAIRLNVIAPGKVIYPDRISLSALSRMKKQASRIVIATVWRAQGTIGGVRIPASQAIFGRIPEGTASVRVKCPDLPEATASLVRAPIPYFIVWLPTESSCTVQYLNSSGKRI